MRKLFRSKKLRAAPVVAHLESPSASGIAAPDAVLEGVASPEAQLSSEGQPRDLWDRAYTSLLEDMTSRKYIEAYEQILKSKLEKEDTAEGSESWTGNSREQQLGFLVQKTLKKVDDARWKFQVGERTVVIKAQIDRIVKAVLFAKDFVSSAAGTDPHAALAWAGVSVLLPLLLNPTSQEKALLEGLDYISTFIVRFTIVERIYRGESSTYIKGPDKSDADLRRCFEKATCMAISSVIDSERQDAQWKDYDEQYSKLLVSQGKHFESLMIEVMESRAEQSKLHYDEAESRCLHALSKSTYEDYKNRNPDRVAGTCEWFLQSHRYRTWFESKTSDLLWVTADPGCGKSVLARSLIDRELVNTASRMTCYFFFKDDSPEQRSAATALCAIAHQLCSRDDTALRLCMETYKKNGDMMTSSLLEMWGLLLEISRHVASGDIVCVLDALDECAEGDQKILIDLLNEFYSSNTRHHSRLKFLVTSRPYMIIEERFNEHTIRLAGEDESDIIRREIDLVIKSRVSQIAARKKLSHEARRALEERLLGIENQTYLWLYLTLDGVEKNIDVRTAKKMNSFVNQLPTNIYEAYEAMLSRSPNRKRARKLLHIVLAAVRPLTLREMNVALNLEMFQRAIEEVDLDPENEFKSYIKNTCGLFLKVRHQEVGDTVLR
ncbi:hypothetical protein P7C71_g791, partial [Lecanoromycetidae sp. Uapishka_2]